MKKYKSRDWLNQKYRVEGLSPHWIAILCNCGKTTIWRWLIKLNIPFRSHSEAGHLAKANHCDLSKEARQWIDGELLGDGCLRATSKYSARFTYSSKYLEYVQYVSNTLKLFGIKKTGKIYKKYNKKFDCYSYKCNSLSYEELLPIRNRWYPEGKKIIPRDLKLTPLMLRQEYIGDGCLHHLKKGRPHITLYTNGFPVSDVEWLVKQLNKLGFKSTRQPSENAIGISAKSTKDFLNYIGKSPVKCYDYKWAY